MPTEKQFSGFTQDAIYAATDLANMATSKVRSAEDFAEVAGVTGDLFGRLLRAAKGAAFASGDEEVKAGILDAVRAVGGAAMRLVESMKQSVMQPNDPTNRHKVAQNARAVGASVTGLISALRAGSKGTQETDTDLARWWAASDAGQSACPNRL